MDHLESIAPPYTAGRCVSRSLSNLLAGATITNPTSINEAGMITGYSYDSSSLAHGFLRIRDGSIINFDVPGAANGTYPTTINEAGMITGNYRDANNRTHGFLLSYKK